VHGKALVRHETRTVHPHGVGARCTDTGCPRDSIDPPSEGLAIWMDGAAAARPSAAEFVALVLLNLAPSVSCSGSGAPPAPWWCEKQLRSLGRIKAKPRKVKMSNSERTGMRPGAPGLPEPTIFFSASGMRESCKKPDRGVRVAAGHRCIEQAVNVQWE